MKVNSEDADRTEGTDSLQTKVMVDQGCKDSKDIYTYCNGENHKSSLEAGSEKKLIEEEKNVKNEISIDKCVDFGANNHDSFSNHNEQGDVCDLKVTSYVTEEQKHMLEDELVLFCEEIKDKHPYKARLAGPQIYEVDDNQENVVMGEMPSYAASPSKMILNIPHEAADDFERCVHEKFKFSDLSSHNSINQDQESKMPALVRKYESSLLVPGKPIKTNNPFVDENALPEVVHQAIIGKQVDQQGAIVMAKDRKVSDTCGVTLCHSQQDISVVGNDSVNPFIDNNGRLVEEFQNLHFGEEFAVDRSHEDILSALLDSKQESAETKTPDLPGQSGQLEEYKCDGPEVAHCSDPGAEVSALADRQVNDNEPLCAEGKNQNVMLHSNEQTVAVDINKLQADPNIEKSHVPLEKLLTSERNNPMVLNDLQNSQPDDTNFKFFGKATVVDNREFATSPGRRSPLRELFSAEKNVPSEQAGIAVDDAEGSMTGKACTLLEYENWKKGNEVLSIPLEQAPTEAKEGGEKRLEQTGNSRIESVPEENDDYIPYSGFLPFSGPISHSGFISHSGAVPYSGSLSLRSDSSTTSARSFAFPILVSEWNSSPVKMPPPDRRFMHRKWRRRFCCFCCTACSTRP